MKTTAQDAVRAVLARGVGKKLAATKAPRTGVELLLRAVKRWG